MKKKFLFVITVVIICYQNNFPVNIHHKKSVYSTSDSIKTILFDKPFKDQMIEGKISWYHMITNIPKDEELFSNNLIRKENIPTYIGLALLTGGLSRMDDAGWKFNRSLYDNSGFYHSASNITVFMGNGEFHFMLAGMFASYGLIEHDNTAIKTASNIAEAVLAAGFFVQVLKRITGRESPAATDKTLGSWQFFPSLKEYQNHQPKYYSFPSGHLASATATMIVIANNYPNVKWIKPVGYTLLGILGFSLVSQGMHWYSDLPLGFFIGYSFGNIIAPEVSKLNESNSSENSSSVMLIPSFGYNRIGLNFAFNF